ncbi:hypothetical protein [Halalkalibacillus sediminis]|nr:hypothetical protein [Halalkalibacillus sediminis]
MTVFNQRLLTFILIGILITLVFIVLQMNAQANELEKIRKNLEYINYNIQ